MSLLKNLRNAKWFRGHLYAYKNLLKRRWNQWRGNPFIYNCELFLDTQCNLRCQHCSIAKFQTQPHYKQAMTLREIRHIARKLKRLDCFSCCLVGGELFLRPDLPDIVSIIRRHQIIPTLITNGWLVTEEYVKRLQKAGLFNLGISLMGFNHENCDSFTQMRGALAKQLAAVDISLRCGMTTSICVVPTHEVVASGEYRRMIEFAAQKGIRVNVNYPALAGQFTGCYDELLTKEELKEVRQYFQLPYVTSDFTVMGGGYECPAGRKRIYVLPDGSVCPCTFIHISFGNILKEPLETIMQRIWSTKIFMSRPKICLTGESEAFNRRYLEPVFNAPSLPLYFEDHPLHKAGKL